MSLYMTLCWIIKAADLTAAKANLTFSEALVEISIQNVLKD